MVGAFSDLLRKQFGYLGLFLVVSVWGVLALIATLFYPKSPGPHSFKGRGEKGEQNNEYKRAPGIEAEMT